MNQSRMTGGKRWVSRLALSPFWEGLGGGMQATAVCGRERPGWSSDLEVQPHLPGAQALDVHSEASWRCRHVRAVRAQHSGRRQP